MKKGGGSDGVRLVLGVLVAVVAAGGAAAVALTSRRAPVLAQPAQPQQGAGVGGPALSTDGRTVNVGMVSSIPQARGYDTGPIDYSRNAPGWDFAQLGGR